SAVALGKDDPTALWSGGLSLAYLAKEVEAGTAYIDRALVLNPNLATSWNASGWVRMYLGEYGRAIEHFERAMRLSPLDPLTYFASTGMALTHALAGRYDEAISWATKALHEQPNWATALRALLRLIESLPLQHFDHAQHAVHRRSDFVTHGGEERRFGAIRRFRSIARDRNLMHEIVQLLRLIGSLGLATRLLSYVARALDIGTCCCRFGARPFSRVARGLGGRPGCGLLFEQPHVLNRDCCLVGQRCDQLDLLVGEWPHVRAQHG